MSFFRSLRGRILVWQGVILGLVLAVAGYGAYRHQSQSELRRVDRELRERLTVIVVSMPPATGRPRQVGEGGGLALSRARGLNLSEANAALFEAKGEDEGGFYFLVWRPDGMELARSDGAPAEVERPVVPTVGVLSEVERSRGLFREAFSFTPHGGCLLVGRSMAAEAQAMRDYARWLVTGGCLVWFFGVGGCWWLTALALRPLRAIGGAAERVAEGQLSARIGLADTDRHSELGKLTVILDSTFAKLESAFAQQARFTADAAHELCTPLSIIVAHAQSGLKAGRSTEECREMLEVCLRTARRMERLTRALLALAEADAKGDAAGRERCELQELVREAEELLRPVAAAKGVRVTLKLGAAECVGNADGLGQIVVNLLSNAIEHTPGGGCVRLLTGTEGGWAILRVEDTGAGIAPEHLPHIFERFYRADASRSRATGGVGLGLAICKSIADAHGATLEVKSGPEGSVFVFRIRAVE